MAKKEYTNRFPGVAVGFEIEPGTDNKAPSVVVEMRGLENEEGKRFFVYCSLHENAQEITAKTLRNLGWSCNDITKLEGLGRVVVDVASYNDTYKGKTSERYDIWPRREPRPTLREDDRNSFAARFKALAAASKEHIVTVSEHNAAPDVIPAVRTSNGVAPAAQGGGDADPSSLYA